MSLSSGEGQSYSQAWNAVIANGKLDRATEWAVEMAEYMAQITGIGIATLADSYGTFGGLTWIAAFDSAAQVDQVNEALTQEPEWIKRINDAEDLFLPGSGQVWLNRRIN